MEFISNKILAKSYCYKIKKLFEEGMYEYEKNLSDFVCFGTNFW